MKKPQRTKRSLEALKRISVQEFKRTEKGKFVYILNNIRSLQNVGTFFRTGDAFRVSHIYLSGITGTPPHRDIHKTALGATESVTWSYHNDCYELITSLLSQGWIVCSVEQTTSSISLENFQFSKGKKYAFVFGNEVKGVDQAIIDISSEVIEIPQYGTKHSLNVSVSAAVVTWDYHSKSKGTTS